MNENTSLPERLARLAVGRATLLQALASAQACGDRKFIDDNRYAREEYDNEIESLKAMATEAELQEAANITNARI